MADEARVLEYTDDDYDAGLGPFVGPPGPHTDGTIVVNEEDGGAYFWNALATPPRFEPLR